QQRTVDYVGRAGHAPRAILEARALAYHDVFLITAAIVLPAIVLALFLRPSQGRAAIPAGRREDGEAPCDYLERDSQEGKAAELPAGGGGPRTRPSPSASRRRGSCWCNPGAGARSPASRWTGP